MPQTGGSSANVKWVEGLRGLASVLVVTTHLARAWDFALFYPKDWDNVPGPRMWQLPIIRVPFQGRIGVPIFAFLTGFVCALKPLKLAYHHDNPSAALSSVARSAFRRVPRLVLPSTIATLIGFIAVVFGGLKTATRCDSFWVRFDAPNAEPTFAKELRRLFRTLLSVWTDTDNPYDRHQWAMRPLLVGAFQVYVLVAATMGMRFRYRVVVHVALLIYWWLNRAQFTETFGANLALGTLLADLSLHRPTQAFISARQRLLSLVVAPLLLLIGLYIGSYPQEHEDWMGWSLGLHNFFVNPDAPAGSRGSLVVPEGTDARRRLSALCVHLCAVAIFVSASLRELLSHRYLQWLGHHSFAVYLVHGTILRTVGVWIIYGWDAGEPWNPPGMREDGTTPEPEWLKRRGRAATVVSVIVFIILTYSAAWAWMKYVDSACARATVWLEHRLFEPKDAASDAEKGRRGATSASSSSAANGHPPAAPILGRTAPP